MSTSGDTERIDFVLAVKNTESEFERFGEAYGRLKTLSELVKEGLVSIPEASARVNMTATQFVIEMGKAERDIHFYEQIEILLILYRMPKLIDGITCRRILWNVSSKK